MASSLVVSYLLLQKTVFSFIFPISQVWICNDESQQKDLQHSGWSCYAVGSYKYDSVVFSLVRVHTVLFPDGMLNIRQLHVKDYSVNTVRT